MKYVKRSEGYFLAVCLIEDQWEDMNRMTADDMWSYLQELCYPGMESLTREESDHLHHVSF